MKRKYIDLGNRIYTYINNQITNTDLRDVNVWVQNFYYQRGRKIHITASGDYSEAYKIMEMLSVLFNTRNINIQYNYMTQKYVIDVNEITQDFVEKLITTTEWENNDARS